MRSIMSSLVRRSLRFSRLSPFAPPRQLHSSPYFASSSSPIKLSSKPSLFHPFQCFSSSSSSSSSVAAKKIPTDTNLSKALQSEIECAEEEKEDDLQQGGRLPDGFPFEIIDNPGEETITLKREYDGEHVEVLVHMPHMDGEEDEEDNGSDADEDDDNDKNSDQFNMPLTVTVIKGDGPHLEFCCTASPDDVTIDSMLMKGPEDSSDEIPYEGPEFSDLDENLQKEFHEYLERRGIKSSLTNFLQEYMVNKDNKEYMLWLKNMKEFVEK